jgi:GNAT superfamily N-acetyltransferase
MNPDREKRITFNSIEIEPMRDEHVKPSIELWKKQYRAAKHSVPVLPEKWVNDFTAITAFLKEHAGTGRGLVAKTKGDMVGYMVYDVFSFHGADTAFCPVMGHASVESRRARIYQEMYRCLSDVWVGNAILDHIISFFSADPHLRQALFNLGFGLYVVDAFRSTDPVDSDGEASIRQASLKDVEDLACLGEESRRYYRESPIFLVRRKQKRGYYEDFIRIKEAAVFVAELEGKTVGFMSIRKKSLDDVITLADKDTATIDELGAYIQPAHRGHGVGAQLLSSVIGWCSEQGIDQIHVDYESANLYAAGFWSKHFTPTMYSVRRRINPDILHG